MVRGTQMPGMVSLWQRSPGLSAPALRLLLLRALGSPTVPAGHTLSPLGCTEDPGSLTHGPR